MGGSEIRRFINIIITTYIVLDTIPCLTILVTRRPQPLSQHPKLPIAEELRLTAN